MEPRSCENLQSLRRHSPSTKKLHGRWRRDAGAPAAEAEDADPGAAAAEPNEDGAPPAAVADCF